MLALTILPSPVTTLVDAADVIRRGGTGERANWMLAGGLRPDNVVDALHAVRPFAIDVSSGVEAEPGVKDAERMRALFAAIRAGEGVTS